MTWRTWLLFAAALLLPTASLAQTPTDRNDEELVASLAGGRVIVQVAQDDTIIFAAIQRSLEAGGSNLQVINLDARHVGILLGATEWRHTDDPKPIRMEQGMGHLASNVSPYSYEGNGEPDLELIGTAFLEKLRPIVSQLRHKIDFPADQPLFEIVVLGYGPGVYGAEIWTIEYKADQAMVATHGEYWETRIQRPRFEQLYPPEKHSPHILVETTYPPPTRANREPELQTLIEGNDPRFAPLREDVKFAKLIGMLQKGQAQKADPLVATDFLRAAVPLLAPNEKFVLGTVSEQHGFEWVVPPEEPMEKAEEDKNRPPDAPSLRRKPDPNPNR